MSSKLYRIDMNIVKDFLDKDLIEMFFLELAAHLPMGNPNTKFPVEFYVSIQVEEEDGVDDTNGLKYYRNPTDTKPFMVMGYSDNNFYSICVLWKAMSKLTDILSSSSSRKD